LIHVAYKVAYELGDEYLSALDEHRETVARNVTENLLNRHLLPLFAAESVQKKYFWKDSNENETP
jgi:hypothetical protein